MSGILLGKTFGAQDRSDRPGSASLNRELARLQIRQAMVGRWFFMIIGTIFSIMPAFVYWLAGTMAANGSPERPDGRRHRRVHDAPEPPVLPARAAAQRPGRDPGVARAVRPDLRVPRPRPRDHRRAGRDRAASPRRCAAPWRSRASRSTTSRSRPRPGRPSATRRPPSISSRTPDLVGAVAGDRRRGGVRRRRPGSRSSTAGAPTSPCSRSASTTSRSRRSRASWWRSWGRRAPARRRRRTSSPACTT